MSDSTREGGREGGREVEVVEGAGKVKETGELKHGRGGYAGKGNTL